MVSPRGKGFAATLGNYLRGPHRPPLREWQPATLKA